MPNGTQIDEPKTKLKELLKELFQCDFGELDFGIYRIMNYRRKEIEKFIDEDLIEIVDKEFEKFKEQNKEELLKKLSEKENEIKKTEENLGEKILENGEIIEEYKNKKIGKEYIQIKKELNELKITEDIQNQVFRDIYNIDEIPTLHFDRHLYTPLVIYNEHKKHIHSEPEKLNEGETEFIRLLRNYVKENKIKDKEIYLLRNLSKRGVNFFQTSGYYPDFIMWVKEQNEQTIVFIDPKGTRNLGPLDTDEKIQLHRYLKENVQPRIEEEYPEINLNSFILSITPSNEVKRLKGKTKEEFEENNVLFLKDDKEEAIKKLFEKIKS